MRYSPRNIKVACDHEGLTHVGGIHFFHEFVRVLQLRNFLVTHLTYPRRNNRYHLSQMILALLYPMVLGLDRLETASFLRSNGTFQYLTGLPSFPDPQTLRRFLLQAPDCFWEQIHRVNDRLLQHTSRHSRDSGSCRCRLWFQPGLRNSGISTHAICRGGPLNSGLSSPAGLALRVGQSRLGDRRVRASPLPGELTRPQNRPVLRLRPSPLIDGLPEKILQRLAN